MSKRLTGSAIKPAYPRRPSWCITGIRDASYAKMEKDKRREQEATEWAEVTFKDIANETA